MAATPFTALVNPALITGIQPGLLGIKPVITHDAPLEDIGNTELRKIAEDVTNVLKASLTAVVARPNAAVRPGSIEADFKVAFNQFAPEIRAAATARAKALLDSSQTDLELVFGRYAGLPAQKFVDDGFDRIFEDMPALSLDFKRLGFPTSRIEVPAGVVGRTIEGLLIPGAVVPSFEEFESTMEAAAAEAVNTGVFDHSRLTSALDTYYYDQDPFVVIAPGEEFEAQQVTNKLRIWVRSVKCIDETNPEWWGNDEIALAGLSIDEDGDVKKIAERFVGSGFSDGRDKTLNWNYHWFSLSERPYWPKKFGVTFIPAEKDHGGLSAFLQKLWDKVKEAVHKALEKAAQAAGVTIATFLGLPEIGPLLGTLLAKAANWAIDKLVGWLIRLLQDDIFSPKTAWITVPSLSARWYYPNEQWGSTVSPLLSQRFTGHGGQYDVQYQWELYA